MTTFTATSGDPEASRSNRPTENAQSPLEFSSSTRETSVRSSYSISKDAKREFDTCFCHSNFLYGLLGSFPSLKWSSKALSLTVINKEIYPNQSLMIKPLNDWYKGSNVATIIARYIFDDYGDHSVIIGRSIRSDEYIFIIENVSIIVIFPWEYFNRGFQSFCSSINYLYVYWTKSSEFKRTINISFSKIHYINIITFLIVYLMDRSQYWIRSLLILSTVSNIQPIRILLHFFCRSSFPTASRWLVLDKSASVRGDFNKIQLVPSEFSFRPSMMRIYDVVVACWL